MRVLLSRLRAGGDELIRPANLIGKTCVGCGEPVVLTVLDRFRPSGGR